LKIEPFAGNIWTASGRVVRAFGFPFQTRMIVVKLRDGSLWINSPVISTQREADSIAELGPVRYLVSPTPMHSWRVRDCANFFPDAQRWGPPRVRFGVDTFPYTLMDRPPPTWSDDFDQIVFRGSFVLNEVYFLHKASRTLIVADFFQNYDARQHGWPLVMLLKMLGVLGGGVPVDVKLSFIAGRARGRASLQKMLTLDFDKLIVAHGDCIQSGAKQVIARAFSFLA